LPVIPPGPNQGDFGRFDFAMQQSFGLRGDGIGKTIARTKSRPFLLRGALFLAAIFSVSTRWTVSSHDAAAFALPGDAGVSWPAKKSKDRGKGKRSEDVVASKKKGVPKKKTDGFGESTPVATSSDTSSDAPVVAAMDVMEPRPYGSRLEPPSKETLKAQHGKGKWQAVKRVFEGQPADSPETAMRARFSALVQKDVVFLGETEIDEDKKEDTEALVKGWRITLGLEEEEKVNNFLSPLAGILGVSSAEDDDSQALKKAVSFEVLDTVGDVVEFKIRCEGGRTLWEKSIFNEDETYGYIFSGDSVFGRWEDEEAPKADAEEAEVVK